MSFSGEKQNDIGYASWQSDHCLAFTMISLFQFADIDGMFGAMCPTQLNRVIACFKCMQVVWFCLVSNLGCKLLFLLLSPKPPKYYCHSNHGNSPRFPRNSPVICR
jgi:hypothetical protein